MDTITGTDIYKAQTLLQAGELVAIPTETVYGLAANALNEDAVLKIFQVKNRPAFNPLIIHCSSWEKAGHYVQDVPNKAMVLAKVFTPGPLTFLLPKNKMISDLVTAGSDRVAVRIPNHPLTLRLLQLLDFPLAAPSANPFGYISPTTAGHVMKSLAGKIPYILDGGSAGIGVESTIIGFDENEQVILHRSGGISVEAMEAVLNEPIIIASDISTTKPLVPGQLKSHYAPNTPLYLGKIEKMLPGWINKKIAIISFTKYFQDVPPQQQFVLSPNGSLAEAAKNLFAALRAIDQLQVDVILAEIFPNEGIGRAINDRLGRAGAAFR